MVCLCLCLDYFSFTRIINPTVSHLHHLTMVICVGWHHWEVIAHRIAIFVYNCLRCYCNCWSWGPMIQSWYLLFSSVWHYSSLSHSLASVQHYDCCFLSYYLHSSHLLILILLRSQMHFLPLFHLSLHLFSIWISGIPYIFRNPKALVDSNHIW